MQRPEHELLLTCARINTEDDRRESLRSIVQQPIDWNFLLDQSSSHRLTSLLYRQLYSVSRESIPADILERLREHHLAVSGRKLLLTAELLKILDLFSGGGIDAIPFKGPVLAHSLYEDPALREFSDLDILVRKQSVFRALKLLTKMGYKSIPNYSSTVEEQILKREYHLLVETESGNKCVEIHWHLVPRQFSLPLFTRNWWQRIQYVPIHSRQVPNLAGEDLLMALSTHGCRHMWESLGLIIDVARLLHRAPALDWDYVFREYDHADLRRIIYLGLIISHDILNAAVPQEILRRATRDSAAVALASQVREQLFRPNKQTPFRYFEFQLRLKTRWLDRLRFVFRVSATPTLLEWKIPLPRLLFPLYFILRPFRLLRKHLFGQQC